MIKRHTSGKFSYILTKIQKVFSRFFVVVCFQFQDNDMYLRSQTFLHSFHSEFYSFDSNVKQLFDPFERCSFIPDYWCWSFNLSYMTCISMILLLLLLLFLQFLLFSLTLNQHICLWNTACDLHFIWPFNIAGRVRLSQSMRSEPKRRSKKTTKGTKDEPLFQMMKGLRYKVHWKYKKNQNWVRHAEDIKRCWDQDWDWDSTIYTHEAS